MRNRVVRGHGWVVAAFAALGLVACEEGGGAGGSSGTDDAAVGTGDADVMTDGGGGGAPPADGGSPPGDAGEPQPDGAVTPPDGQVPPPDAAVTPPDGGPPDLPDDCAGYCALMLASCPAVYPDQAACQATCAVFPPTGQVGDTGGNTLQCRIYHADAARENGALHCPHAMALGGDACGAPCDGYCDQLMAHCPTAFPDRDKCLSACAVLPRGEVDAQGGNSVECRTYHASFPAAANAALHCPHARLGGAGVCGSPCEAYCDQAVAHCPTLYPQKDACLAACEAFPTDPNIDAQGGNSVECRLYHASFPAAMDAELHCPHASLTGAGVCGDACEAYCDQIAENCPANYADRATCLTACEGFPADGAFDATGGNSVQCRAYHSSFPAAAAPDLHCPHATPSGGEVCGDFCEAYCDQVESNCAGLYPDRPTCEAACARMPRGALASATDGDSVQCRLNAAARGACDAASPVGGGVCGTPCEGYCAQVTSTCPSIYPDRAACLSACVAMPSGGAFDDATGNTVQCRAFHAAIVAPQDAVTGCAGASINGGGTCGTRCDAYCDQNLANCGDYYPNRSACEFTCRAFPEAGEFDATAGDSVECRAYHSSFPAAADQGTHCPHASVTGGGADPVCGTPCDGYCRQVLANCPGIYVDEADCRAACSQLDGLAPFNATTGNNVQCRAYYASFPTADGGAEAACPAAESFSYVCIDPVQ